MKPATALPWFAWHATEQSMGGLEDKTRYPFAYMFYADAAYAAHAANLYPELVEALKEAQELITTARQYFPKSMHNGNKFSLEVTCGAIGTVLAKAGEG